MRTLGNIIWHIPFLGFLFSLAYALGGLFFCITVIGIPIGLGWLQFSLFLLSPFSKAMVSREELDLLTGKSQSGGMQTFSTIVRILYFPFGLFAAIGALCTIIGEFISIIGIPCGIVWAKSLSTIFNPVNKVCVPRAVAMEIERRKEAGTLEKYTSQNPNTDSADKRRPMTNEYIEKAQDKSDDELKDILRQKDDYNPKLVNAAEKVLYARITGTEIVEEYQPTTFTYNSTLDFTKLRGEVLIMIGMLLPIVIVFILNLLSDMYVEISKCYISPNIAIIKDNIWIFSCIAGIVMISKGVLKIKKESEDKSYIGAAVFFICSFLLLTLFILNFICDDCRFSYFGNDYESLFHISFETSLKIINTASPILNILYSLFIAIAIILWKYLDKHSKLNTIGMLFICFALTIDIIYMIFYSNINEYVTGGIQENSSSMFYLNYAKTILYIFLSIYGWYKFIGLDTQKNYY